jgi:hypothetical protein
MWVVPLAYKKIHTQEKVILLWGMVCPFSQMLTFEKTMTFCFQAFCFSNRRIHGSDGQVKK